MFFLAEYANAGTTDSLAGIITFLIISWAVGYFTYGCFSKKVKPLKFNDKFDLGYIDGPEESHCSTTIVLEEKPKSKDNQRKSKAVKKAKEIIKEQEKDINLAKKCAQFLVLMGTPIRKAKVDAEILLEKYPEITTIEEFIERYNGK